MLSSLREQGLVALSSGGSVGRPRLTDLYLSRLAKLYVTTVDAGDSKPIETISSLLEAAGVPASLSAVKDQLRKAEKNGLLDRQGFGRGKPGGRLTAQAKRILSTDGAKAPLKDLQYWKGRTS
jgi:hypothetical protein